MRTEKEILADLTAAREAYHLAPSREKTARIKAAQAELSALLSAGAGPCKVCGTMPHGVHKRPGVFEVGCLKCINGPRADGETSAEAVQAWNAGRLVGG